MKLNRFYKKTIILVCFSLCLILSSLIKDNKINSQMVSESTILTPNNVYDLKILAIIANGFGDAYFWVKEQLESWGCNVTTAGLTSVCSSCPNKPQRPVTSDILIADVTLDILSQFDCVYVPPGAHWTILIFNTATQDLLTMAYQNGLVVSALCIGTKILAHANNIVEGVKVCYYTMSYSDMVDAGAIIVPGVGVVSDKKMITGSSGVHEGMNPYVYPFCVAMVKAALGLSTITNIGINPNRGKINQTYIISVDSNDLSTNFDENYTHNILSIAAVIHTDNPNDNQSIIYLTDPNTDNTYTGNYTGTIKGNYKIDLEIKGSDWGLEIIRDAINFKIRVLPGFELLVIPITLLSIIALRKLLRK